MPRGVRRVRELVPGVWDTEPTPVQAGGQNGSWRSINTHQRPGTQSLFYLQIYIELNIATPSCIFNRQVLLFATAALTERSNECVVMSNADGTKWLLEVN